jgi:hypothetical protein
MAYLDSQIGSTRAVYVLYCGILASLALTISLHAQETVLWSKNDARCSSSWTNGILIKTIKHRNLILNVSLEDRNGHFEAGAMAYNGTDVPLDVLPTTFAIASARDKNARIIHSLPLEKVLAKMNWVWLLWNDAPDGRI